MWRLHRSLAFGTVIALVAGLALAEESREGLVVLETSAPGGSPDAGPRPDDVLLSWSSGTSSGLLRWPSGLEEVETEQAPRGTVVLRGRRGHRPMSWQMPTARWELRTRPALPPSLLALYEEGAEGFSTRDPDKGAESWRAAAREATRVNDKSRAAWFLGELGNALSKERQWSEADSAYFRARELAQGSGLEAPLLRDWGAMLVQAENWPRAELCYRQALALAPPGSYTAARDRAAMAAIAIRRGDLENAESLYRQALADRARLGTLGPYLVQVVREEIDSFGSPDQPGATREEIAEVRQKLQRLRETLLELAGAPVRAESQKKIAVAVPKKPEPSPLETLQKALAKVEREAPGTLAVSDRWQELGELAWEQGDRVAAEIAWLRALDLREKLAPGTLREARTLHDLGWVHASAKRDRAAASFFCRAAGALDRMGHLPPIDNPAWDALGARPATYDEHCVNALVASGRPNEAFLALERSHLRGAAPPLSADLIRRSREIDTDRDQALARLARLSTSRDRDEVDLLVDYAGELETQRTAITGPRDLDALRAALPLGSLLLAWSIGDERSFLFLVRSAETPGPGIEVLPIRAHASDLRERVRTFATDAGSDRWTAADLYRQLFEPADEQIAKAETLLLLPGEILAPLPFRALVRGDSPLVKQKPLETATSVTAWAALQKILQDTKDAKGSP